MPAGIGAYCSLAVLKEQVPGVPGDIADALFVSFLSETMSDNRATILDESIFGNRMLTGVEHGKQQGGGGVNMNIDGVNFGQMAFFANGDDGYSKGAAYTVPAAPTGVVSSGGSLVASTAHYYKSAMVLTRTSNGESVIMPSTASSTVYNTTSPNKTITLTITHATITALIAAGYTHTGTILYRGTTAGSETFLKYIAGTGTSFVDDGVYSAMTFYAIDLTVIPYSASIVKHVFVAPLSDDNEEPLSAFTIFINKNNDVSEEYLLNRVQSMKVGASGGNDTIKSEFNMTCQREIDIVNFSPGQQVFAPFVGWRSTTFFNGAKDCNLASWEFTLANAVVPEEGMCGVDYDPDNVTGDRRINGQFNRRFTTHHFHDLMKSDDEFALVHTAFGQPIVRAGSSTTLATHGIKAVPFRYGITITFPRLLVTKAGKSVDGKGQLIETVEWQAAEDFVTGTDMKIEIYNTVADYNAVP